MFRKGPYQEMIKKLEERDKRGSFEPNKKLPGSWVSNEEPKSQPGKSKGLTLILDAHSDKVASSSITEDVDGCNYPEGSSQPWPDRQSGICPCKVSV